MKKIICFILSMVMLLGLSFTAFAESVDVEASANEIYNYLCEAGYPADIIASLDDNTRLRYYEGQYQYESSSTSYGIFTEDYNVEYSINANGEVVIDEENLSSLEALLKDTNTVTKIISDKAVASETSAISLSVNTVTPNVNEMNFNSIEKAINAGKTPIELASLSNWTGKIVCSHISYNSSTKVAKKNFTYTWKWEYSPVWTLTDKVAMAWSGGFTAEPSTIYWSYVKRSRPLTSGGIQYNTTTNGYGYDDYNPNAGVAKGINITCASGGSAVVYHSGTLSTEVTKVVTTESRESAVGCYYHTKILPSLSLSFSKTGPSISISSKSGVVDKSSDSAVAFWSMKAG